MAERKLNLEAPLLSTRRMQKKTSAVSVRRNKTYDFTHDHSSSSVPVLVTEMGLDHFTDSASVPFTWEQAPGRLKGYDPTPQEVFFTPCLPPGKAIDRNLSLKGKPVDKEEEKEESEDVFSDARDTLSPKDSFSVNHSISGVSGYGAVAEKKKTLKNHCEDSQSWDFMLNRFLPAAKAMTMEQPQYALNRKPSSFMPEPTLQIRELVPEEKRQNSNRYDESLILPYLDHHQDIDNEESEEEDGEVSEYAYLPRRGCGMLPQLCFKESLGMMNTVSGFKTKQKSPTTSASQVSKLKSRFQSVKQMAFDSVSKHKLSGKVQSPVDPSVGKKFSSETNLTCSASRSSSPYRHPRCMSPFRTRSNSSPFRATDTRMETENLRANRLNKHIRGMSMSQELPDPKDNGSTSSLLEKKPDTNLELEEFENVSIGSGKDRSPLAPPSPKKPSESWLLHNLPSRGYPFHTQKQDLNDKYRNVTKWETIVKTSYMHRDHIRYSEELVAHTSLQ